MEIGVCDEGDKKVQSLPRGWLNPPPNNPHDAVLQRVAGPVLVLIPVSGRVASISASRKPWPLATPCSFPLCFSVEYSTDFSATSTPSEPPDDGCGDAVNSDLALAMAEFPAAHVDCEGGGIGTGR